MNHLLLTLITVGFLLVGGLQTFSQTTKNSSKKLVKCYEKGKVVYRTKCKTKKRQSVSKKSEPVEKYGDPLSKFEVIDNGTGTGGGMVAGRGTGTGTGTGTGSGSGNGAGIGSGSEEDVPPKTITGESGIVGLKIISKPKAEYTELARTNQVNGTVTLRVTFLANGTIGSVSPINGLPDGLTQQAIKAARLIKFTPQTKNGKPITVTKQIQYSFTLY